MGWRRLAGTVLGGTLTRMRDDEDRRAAERRLVRQAQNGDLLAFERLYRDNERKVFGLCLRLSSDAALAEELTQEVFVRAWRKLGELPRRERLLLLALPDDRERGALASGGRDGGATRASSRPTTRRAWSGRRAPRDAGGGLRPREGDGGAAARARGPCSCSTTWKAGLTTRSRRC